MTQVAVPPPVEQSALVAARRQRSRREGSTGSRVGRYVYLTAVAVFAIGPLLLAWTTAFKSSAQVVSNPYGLPIPPTLDNLVRAWTTGLFGEYFGNSVIISLTCVVCMVILASMVGYALARIRFWG